MLFPSGRTILQEIDLKANLMSSSFSALLYFLNKTKFLTLWLSTILFFLLSPTQSIASPSVLTLVSHSFIDIVESVEP